jgi:putative endonuclease
MDKAYYVYILTNKWRTVLYTGVTNNIRRRAAEHKGKVNKGFTARYNVDRLVYYEVFQDIRQAITREKQIKAGSRTKKLSLIKAMNPSFLDISESL